MPSFIQAPVTKSLSKIRVRAGRAVYRAARNAPVDVPSQEDTLKAAACAPEVTRRQTLDALFLVAAGLPLAFTAYPVVHVSARPDGGAVSARDVFGGRVLRSAWLKTHGAGDHSLVQGLLNDPFYLVVRDDGLLDDVGLNAVCPHMGCIVPWVAAERRFICPCHGSQFDARGAVVHGPAPLPLALAHVNVRRDDAVVLDMWTEEDNRGAGGSQPWWVADAQCRSSAAALQAFTSTWALRAI